MPDYLRAGAALCHLPLPCQPVPIANEAVCKGALMGTQAGEVAAEAWAGAQRFCCILTTVTALLEERSIAEVDLLKVSPLDQSRLTSGPPGSSLAYQSGESLPCTRMGQHSDGGLLGRGESCLAAKTPVSA